MANSIYKPHKEGYDNDDIPFSLSTTGIPGLRFNMLKYPAKAKLDALKQYSADIVPSLVDSMNSWATQFKIHRRKELRDIVARPRQVLQVQVLNLTYFLADDVQNAEGKIAAYVEELTSFLEEGLLPKISLSFTSRRLWNRANHRKGNPSRAGESMDRKRLEVGKR